MQINVCFYVYSVDHGGEIMMTAGLRKCRSTNTPELQLTIILIIDKLADYFLINQMFKKPFFLLLTKNTIPHYAQCPSDKRAK